MRFSSAEFLNGSYIHAGHREPSREAKVVSEHVRGHIGPESRAAPRRLEGGADLLKARPSAVVNTGGAVSSIYPPAALSRAFKTRRFLFLGYSLEDWNFRAFLRLLVLRNAVSGKSKLRHWAIQLGPSKLDEALWFQRNVHVYDGDLGKFCGRLEEAWPPKVSP